MDIKDFKKLPGMSDSPEKLSQSAMRPLPDVIAQKLDLPLGTLFEIIGLTPEITEEIITAVLEDSLHKGLLQKGIIPQLFFTQKALKMKKEDSNEDFEFDAFESLKLNTKEEVAQAISDGVPALFCELSENMSKEGILLAVSWAQKFYHVLPKELKNDPEIIEGVIAAGMRQDKLPPKEASKLTINKKIIQRFVGNVTFVPDVLWKDKSKIEKLITTETNYIKATTPFRNRSAINYIMEDLLQKGDKSIFKDKLAMSYGEQSVIQYIDMLMKLKSKLNIS